MSIRADSRQNAQSLLKFDRPVLSRALKSALYVYNRKLGLDYCELNEFMASIGRG